MTTRRQFLSLAAGAAVLPLLPAEAAAMRAASICHVIFTPPISAIGRAVVMVRWIGDTDWFSVPVSANGLWSFPADRTGTLEVMSYAVNQPAIAEPSHGDTGWHEPNALKPARPPCTNPNDAWRGKRYGR